MRLLAIPLGWIMKGCYMLVKNYGLALLLFTIITRLITLPLNIKQQKSTARMSSLQPEIEKLKKKYGKNQEKLNEETMKLYSEYQINPMASCLPMIVSMILLFAMIPVVYGPLTYVSSAEKDNVTAANSEVKTIYSISSEVDSGDGDMAALIGTLKGEDDDAKAEELLEILNDSDNYSSSAKALSSYTESEQKDIVKKFIQFDGLDKFMTNKTYFTQNMMNSAYGPEVLLFNFQSKEDGKYFEVLNADVRSAISEFDYTFFGMDLGKIPSKKDATVMIPIISFILQLATTIISQVFQKRNNPDVKLNSSMLMMLILMPLFSLWIGFKFPCALGVYWIYSSMFAVFQVIFLNIVYSPAKLKVIAEKEAQKAKEKRKKKGPSFMERAIEIRNEQGAEMPTKASARKYVEEEDEEDDGEPAKLSKTQIKEQNRQKLNEARKRYAEKYGDEYTDE
jgi:YidC/Oxa1 family membrane protein insertase